MFYIVIILNNPCIRCLKAPLPESAKETRLHTCCCSEQYYMCLLGPFKATSRAILRGGCSGQQLLLCASLDDGGHRWNGWKTTCTLPPTPPGVASSPRPSPKNHSALCQLHKEHLLDCFLHDPKARCCQPHCYPLFSCPDRSSLLIQSAIQLAALKHANKEVCHKSTGKRHVSLQQLTKQSTWGF